MSQRPDSKKQKRTDSIERASLCLGGNAMGRFLFRTLIGGAGLLVSSTFAFAGEQVLEFKLVTKLLDPKVVQAANIDGQTMMTRTYLKIA
jgi:hypothetical protein